MSTPFKMSGFPYPGTSPTKTKVGRWLMGRKKHVEDDGTIVITDRHGRIVKTKKDGVKTKYKRGSRPMYEGGEGEEGGMREYTQGNF